MRPCIPHFVSACHKDGPGLTSDAGQKILTSTHLTDVQDMISPVTNFDALMAPSSGLKKQLYKQVLSPDIRRSGSGGSQGD
jgi:hypothetical protein